MFDEPIPPKDDLDHSVLFDVHTHSDYSEVNAFIDEIYSAHSAGPFTVAKRKHLKVVLLHLYVVWCEDPTLYTAVSFDKNEYTRGSRYNSIHISCGIIVIIKEPERIRLTKMARHTIGKLHSSYINAATISFHSSSKSELQTGLSAKRYQ